jgi:hypothetical protein
MYTQREMMYTQMSHNSHTTCWHGRNILLFFSFLVHAAGKLERGKIKISLHRAATARSLSLSQISLRTDRPSPASLSAVARRPALPAPADLLQLSLYPAFFLSPALPAPPDSVVRRLVLPAPADSLQLSLSLSGGFSLSGASRFARFGGPSLRRSLSAAGLLCRPADLVSVQLCLRQIFSPTDLRRYFLSFFLFL